MTKYLQCSACGFIIDENKLGEVCPACGAKRQAFKPLEDKISEKRRKRLGLHLHPVIVHFPNGFSSFSVLLIIFTMIFPSFLRSEILNTILILSLILPFTVILSILAGIFDGKLRFKRLKTPYLRKKIIIGTLFFIFSIVLFIIALILGTNPDNLLIYLVFWSACLICGGLLGKIGGQLLCAKIPG